MSRITCFSMPPLKCRSSFLLVSLSPSILLFGTIYFRCHFVHCYALFESLFFESPIVLNEILLYKQRKWGISVLVGWYHWDQMALRPDNGARNNYKNWQWDQISVSGTNPKKLTTLNGTRQRNCVCQWDKQINIFRQWDQLLLTPSMGPVTWNTSDNGTRDLK